MRKSFIKYLLVFTVVAGSAAAIVYAQRGYIFRSGPSAGKEEPGQDEQPDDIGQPTNDNPWNEMEKLVDAYYNEKGVTFRGTVKLIDDNGENEKVLEEHPFEYAVLNDNFYYSLDKIEVVSNNNIALVADNSNRLISVSDKGASTDKKQQLFDIGEFKKLMKERKAEAKVTKLGNEKILTIENIQDPQIQGYRIHYDPATYRISKMLIGIVRFSPLDEGETQNGDEQVPSVKEEKQTDDAVAEEEAEQAVDTYTYYLEIVYREMTPMNAGASDFHPENKFIRKNGGKTELTPAYGKYQLIVNSQEPEEKKIMEDREEQ